MADITPATDEQIDALQPIVGSTLTEAIKARIRQEQARAEVAEREVSEGTLILDPQLSQRLRAALDDVARLKAEAIPLAEERDALLMENRRVRDEVARLREALRNNADISPHWNPKMFKADNCRAGCEGCKDEARIEAIISGNPV